MALIPGELLAAGIAVGAGLTLALRNRLRLPRMVVAGIVLWGVGLTMNIAGTLTAGTPQGDGSAALVGIGQALWVVAAVAVFGSMPADSVVFDGYPRHQWWLDSLMICVAWGLLVWRLIQPQSDGHGPFAVAGLAVVLLAELLMAVMVLQLAANTPNPVIIGIGVGLALIVLAEVLGATGASAPTHAVTLLCGAAVVLISLVATRPLVGTLRRNHRERDISRSWYTVLIFILPLLISALVRLPSPDLVSRLLTATVLVSYVLREVARRRAGRDLMQRLAEQALIDPLTGLGNRRAFTEALEQLARGNEPVLVVSLDVDRFKEVNRQLGHAAGDRLLVLLAQVLIEQVPGPSFRFGGDEFAVLIPDPGSRLTAAPERLRAACAAAMADSPEVDSLAVTVSIGVALWRPDTDDDPFEVLSRSTQALRSAKGSRDRVRVFTDSDAAELDHRDALEQCLRQALRGRGIDFHYQPIVRIEDGVVVAVESLARWNDPVLGQVNPEEFIALAEETGLITELGMHGLQHGLATVVDLRKRGFQISVSVNVSPVQLRRQGFARDLARMIAAHGAQPGWLSVEVTEGVFIGMDDPVVSVLDSLAQLGVGVSIDDFGSGYSSLGYITRLPANTIKIDKSLSKRVDHPRARSIIAAMVGIADAHRLRVIVEGVETTSEAEQLAALGVSLCQGWLFSRDVTADLLPETIERLARDGGRIPQQRAASH
ncbi:MAG: putative bifunctional diguanylate cyclase/phosphodiesterase [Actinomycetales bacterium]